jgi:Rrf2 family protein
MAEKQHLSLKYLERIMTDLKAAGLVRPIRGMRGGFYLTRPPNKITLRNVYEALEGSLAPMECIDKPETCRWEDTCPTRQTWVEMKRALENVLENTTLQDLATRKRQKEAQARKA